VKKIVNNVLQKKYASYAKANFTYSKTNVIRNTIRLRALNYI
jgi:hypothetical protein